MNKIKYSKDLTNIRFGNYLVLERSEPRKKSNGWIMGTRWKCKCDCGNITIVNRTQLIGKNGSSCFICSNRAKAHKKTLPFGESNFNKLFNSYKKTKHKFSLTKKQFKNLVTSNCYYCNSIPKQILNSKRTNGPFVYNGIDRKLNKRNYTLKNSVSCCWKCNRMKGPLNEKDFILQCKNIIDYYFNV